jgi:leucyl-tRNA synthetase
VWTFVSDACREGDGQELHHHVLVKLHQTKKRVTEGLEELRYNTSIAALMELVNALRADNVCDKAVAEELVIMLAPFAPHFAEELWERMGHRESVFDGRWPGWDEGLVVEDQVEIVVQINGKTRAKVTVARDADEDTVVVAALRDGTVGRFVEGKGLRTRIYVPNRLLNLVVG